MKTIKELKQNALKLKKQKTLLSKPRKETLIEKYINDLINIDVEEFYNENKECIMQEFEESIQKAMYYNEKYIKYKIPCCYRIQNFFEKSKEKPEEKNEIFPHNLIYVGEFEQAKFKIALLNKIIPYIRKNGFLVFHKKSKDIVHDESEIFNIYVFWNKFYYYIYIFVSFFHEWYE